MKALYTRFLIFFLVLALVVVGGVQGRKAVKRTRSRRLVAEAALSFEQKDLQDTAHCLQAAIQANPANVDAIKLAAEFFESTASPAGIGWRIRAAQLQPANMTNRLDWAQTAVKLHDLKSAEDALSGLDEASKSTARYHKVSGALAWEQGKADEAQHHYQEARRLEPDNPSNVLNLGTIGLFSTNCEIAEAARASLWQLVTNNGPLAMSALRHLALDAAKRKALTEATCYAKQLATNSDATFADKLDYLNLLRGTQNANAESWLADLKQEATNSPAAAFALGRWLARAEGPTNALQWLSGLPSEVQTRQPVPLVITDCQIAIKDWAALAATVEDEDWGGAETLRLAIQSLAQRSLGNEEDAQRLWRKVRRESAQHLDRLYQLIQLTSAWGWKAERKVLLIDTVNEFPREKWAVQALVAQLYDEGDTQELEKLLSKLSSREPGNLEMKATLARVCLLRKSDLPGAHKLAKEAYQTAQDNPLMISTYAYSLLMQGQQSKAVSVLDNLKPQALQIPWIAACYGVIEAQSGHKDAAREPLERAQSAKLLPEEMELVRLARSSL